MERKQESVLEHQFNPDVNQFASPVDDYSIKLSNDEKGLPVVVYEKDDFKSLIDSNGTVDDWSLQSLMKAGINPEFRISTSNNSNLETSRQVHRFADAIGAELKDTNVDTQEPAE